MARELLGLMAAGDPLVQWIDVDITVQLRASAKVWRERFELDAGRPSIDDFFEDRYVAAQSTPADHVVETDGLSVTQIAMNLLKLVNSRQ
ncbi:hypothetical protein ACW0JT_02945 [Arthrobacter sp. SA17]